MRVLVRATAGLTDGLVALFVRPESADGDDEAAAIPIIDDLARRAIFLDELRRVGAVFHYPDALSVGEWAALIALGRARAKLEAEASNVNSEDARIRASQQANRQALVAKTGRKG